MRRYKNQTSPRNSSFGYLEEQVNQLIPGQSHGYSISDSDSEDPYYPKRLRIETLEDCYKIEPETQF